MVEANNEKVDQGLTWIWAFNAHPCKDSNNWGFFSFLEHFISKTASNISIQCDTQFSSTVNGNSSSEELSRDINHPKRRTVFNYLKFWIVALQISVVRDFFSTSSRPPTYALFLNYVAKNICIIYIRTCKGEKKRYKCGSNSDQICSSKRIYLLVCYCRT